MFWGSEEEYKKMALLSLLDPLYCQEESLELEEERTGPMPPALNELEGLLVAEEEWAEVLSFLAAKEGETCSSEMLLDAGREHAYLLSARREAVEWMARAAARHAFSFLTVLLAVDYLDRCFLPPAAAGGGGAGLRLQRDKPWMGRLAAAACLSLAAKVEETTVPMLLDLQLAAAPEMEESRFVFEATTIRRMELLVLSALGWRMNPVTPLSFIHHLLARLCYTAAGGAARVLELASLCEALLLSVVADWRWIRYPASAWAAAALLHAAERGGASAAAKEPLETEQLISFLDVPKEKLQECSQIIAEAMVFGGGVFGRKRKHNSPFSLYSYSPPPSPSGVIGSCFSCASSSSSVSSSPETSRPAKKPNAAPPNKGLGGEGIMEDAELFAS